jgi:hypothetical protein
MPALFLNVTLILLLQVFDVDAVIACVVRSQLSAPAFVYQ